MSSDYTKRIEEQVEALESMLKDNDEELAYSIERNKTATLVLLNTAIELYNLYSLYADTNPVHEKSKKENLERIITILEAISEKRCSTLYKENLDYLGDVSKKYMEDRGKLDYLSYPGLHHFLETIPKLKELIDDRPNI